MATEQTTSLEGDSFLLLNEQRAVFRAFLQHRLTDSSEVDDLLQTALLRAMSHRSSLRQTGNVVPWFFKILRRVLIDHYRSSTSRKSREQVWQEDQLGSEFIEECQKVTCSCIQGLFPRLQPRAAMLVRLVDLEGNSISEVSTTLGLSKNAAMVALHRARAQLKGELIAFCGACSEGACLDCTCQRPAM